MSEKQDPFGGETYVQRQQRRREQTGEDKRPPEQRAATYRIGEDVKQRVDETAEAYNVNKGELVAALLTYALNALERGEWELPVGEPVRRKIDLDKL